MNMTFQAAVELLHEALDQMLATANRRPSEIRWLMEMGVTKEEAVRIWERTIGRSGSCFASIAAALEEVRQLRMRSADCSEEMNK